MSSLDITIPHQLTQEEATNRIKKLLSNLQEEQKDVVKDVKEEWNGNEGNFEFSAKGFDISGRLSVATDHVRIKGKLPFLLGFFKDKISGVIQEKAGALLAK